MPNRGEQAARTNLLKRERENERASRNWQSGQQTSHRWPRVQFFSRSVLTEHKGLREFGRGRADVAFHTVWELGGWKVTDAAWGTI